MPTPPFRPSPSRDPSSRPTFDRHHPPGPRPFTDAQEAWFWTVTALRARHDGARARRPDRAAPRPCEPDDVIKCLDQLYRRRRIDLVHARILRIWGERGIAPNPALPRVGSDARLWREALSRLEWPLRAKGIVE